MGLDVKLFVNVKEHHCNETGETHTCYSKDPYWISSLEQANDPRIWKEVQYSAGCSCPETDSISVGFVSCLCDGYFPGYRFSYQECDSFYFGSYMTFFMRSSQIKLFKMMSDCDGYYAGGFLKALHSELKEYIDNGGDDERLGKYFELLDQHYDHLEKCVLQHC